MTVPAVTALTYPLTSYEEMEDILSQHGMDIRIDDMDGPSLERWIEKCVAHGTEKILQFAGQIYSQSDLYTSHWARVRATYVACFWFTMRKGEHPLFEIAYRDILEDLVDLKNLTIRIPGLSQRADQGPSLSNLHVDDRFSYNKQRVLVWLSVGSNGTRQHSAWAFPYLWL